jgi:dienelactone hydrolase
MSISTRTIEHTLDGQIFESLLVFDAAQQGPRPAVLVHHGWEGRSEGQEKFTERLTDQGYAAVAVDLFGKGRRGKTTEECRALMAPLMQDRALVRKRLLKVMEVAQNLPEVDRGKIAAIGFCFGGLCALDLARAGGKVKGVASFHGLFTPPDLPLVTPIDAKVIAFHGWDDPFTPPDQVLAFGKEFTEAKADWQLHAFGGTVHAFMNESADMPEMGLLYSSRAAARAWSELRLFLAEVFAA